MNPILLKQTTILSAILGGILGVLTLIPFVRNFSFMLLILCISAVIIVYMKKNNLIGIIDVREGAILGAVIGFVSFIAFSIVFVPLIAILSFILGLFHVIYYTFGITTLLQMSGFFVLVMLVIFLGLLSALMNAFSGLVTAYVYEMLSGIKKAEHEEHVDFEIKE